MAWGNRAPLHVLPRTVSQALRIGPKSLPGHGYHPSAGILRRAGESSKTGRTPQVRHVTIAENPIMLRRHASRLLDSLRGATGRT
jgi:hypothetical protein